MELGELKEKICKQSNLTLDEVERRIEEKVDELSGLVSEEGAAYIVAKEEGLDLLEKMDRSLKIKNIIPNMRSVEVIGKIIQISDVREFNKGDRAGQVRSISIGDETGQIRVIFWNDKIDLTKNLKEGQVIKVRRGYTKSNNFGMPEVHMGNGSIIEESDKEITVPEKTDSSKKELLPRNIGERKALHDARENDLIETRAAIVSMSEREYYTCPTCGGKLEEIKGKMVCKDHGKIEPSRNLIVKGYVDDGNAAMRFVAFKEVAEKIKKENLIGKDIMIVGRIRKNEYFGDLELLANQVNEIYLDREIERLR